MKTNNNFPEGTWLIFQDAWCCWWCGENTSDCLHHIVGRGNAGSVVESSILNAAPLCNHKCHLPNHGQLRTEEKIKELLQQTLKYLISKGYKLTRNDFAFKTKYAKYYKSNSPK